MAGSGSIITSNIKQCHETDHVPTVNIDYSSIRGKVCFSNLCTLFCTLLHS